LKYQSLRRIYETAESRIYFDGNHVFLRKHFVGKPGED